MDLLFFPLLMLAAMLICALYLRKDLREND